MEYFKAGDLGRFQQEGGLDLVLRFAPDKGTPNHLRSPFRYRSMTIPQPYFGAQQTAIRPFLGSMATEGALLYNQMINKTAF